MKSKKLLTKIALIFVCVLMFVAGFLTLGLNSNAQTVYASGELAPIGGSSSQTISVGTTHTHDDATFTEWTSTTSLPTTAGNYYLADNVTANSNIIISSNVTLCLNGKTVNLGSNYIDIRETFTVCDCNATGGSITGSGAYIIKNCGTFNLYQGTLKGTDTATWGVYSPSYVAFNMYGGTIETGTQGVSACEGTTTIYDGTVTATGDYALYARYDGELNILGGKFTSAYDTLIASDSTTNVYISGSPTFTSTEGKSTVYLNNYSSLPNIYLHKNGDTSETFTGGLNVRTYEASDGLVIFKEVNSSQISNLAYYGYGTSSNATSPSSDWGLRLGTGENANDLVLHKHDYSTVKYDATNHWGECSCGDKTTTTAHNTSGVCTCGVLLINENNFPDANFREYLKGLTSGVDGFFTKEELLAITTLDLEDKEISNLKGIEYFTALISLRCNANKIGSLDLSNNIALKEIYCSNNALTSLDVSNNTALTVLDCQFNDIVSLDVSENTLLEKLYCNSNDLTSLKLDNTSALTYLSCSTNKLTSLDLTASMALKTLYCSGNELASLDLSKNTKLTELYCYSNKLTTLDLSKNTELQTLYCFFNELTSLDLSGLTSLKTLICYRNKFTSLDLSAYESFNSYDGGYHDVDITIDQKTMTFDMATLDENFVVANATVKTEGCSFNGNVLTVKEGTNKVEYSYATGSGTRTITVYLHITNPHTHAIVNGDTNCTTDELCSCEKVIVAKNLSHTYAYSASDNVITETCSVEGCTAHTATATISAPTGTLIYDGSTEFKASVDCSSAWAGGTLTISYTRDGDIISAGEITASITISGQTASVTYTVAKANQSAPSDVNKVDTTYIDTIDGKITGVTNAMEYKLSTESDYITISGTEITNLPSGTYYVRFAENDNHNASEYVSVTINKGEKRTATITNISDIGKTYNSTAVSNPTYTYTNGADGKITITWYADNGGVKGNSIASVPTNAGTYWVGIKASEGTNYKAVSEVTKQFIIGKADYDMNGITFVDGQFTYDGNPHSLVISGTLPTGLDGIQVTVGYSGSATNVSDGEQTVIATFATTSTNYNVPTAKTAKVKINAKDISGATVNLGTALTYNGEEQTQIVTSVVIDGLTATFDISGNTATTVSQTTYTLTVTGKGNFKGAANKDWNLLKATYDMSGITFDNVVFTYSGNVNSIYIDGELPTGVSVAYTNNGVINATISSVDVTANFTGDNVNYNEIPDMTATITVNKANAEISVDTTPIVKTYGDIWELPVATSNFGSVICDKDISDLVNVGEYTVTYSVEGTANYNGDTKTVNVTINKATHDMSGITFVNYTVKYNGETHSLAINGELPNGVTVEYDGNGKVDAGVYTITANFIYDTANFNEIKPMTAILTINQDKVIDHIGETTTDKPHVEVTTDGGFAPNVEIVISEIAVENAEKGESVKENEKVDAVYDITLKSEGVSVQPSGDITIKLLIPTELKDKEFRIIHNHEGRFTEIEYTIDGDYAVFSVNQLSEFIFVSDNTANLGWLIGLLAGIAGLAIISGIILYVKFKKIKAKKNAGVN